MENKRGQGLSTSTIILLVLGLFLLVILIIGFTSGWKKFAPFLGSSNNVKTIVTACETSCTTQSQYNFCTFKRTLKAEGLPKTNGKVPTEVVGNCSFFSKAPGYKNYGIKPCPEITCS